MEHVKRASPATGKACLILADDLLRGAAAIALFLFGDASQRRKVYYLASDTELKLPIFRIGNVICVRKSKLLEWIYRQENSKAENSEQSFKNSAELSLSIQTSEFLGTLSGSEARDD